MDRLAAEVVRLTDAHATSAVCTPSRYALLTGRYCWHMPLQRRVLYNCEPPLIERGRLTLASLLKEKGCVELSYERGWLPANSRGETETRGHGGATGAGSNPAVGRGTR